MAEGEEPLGSSGVNTAGVTVPERDATARGVARAVVGSDDVEVGSREPLLPLQNPWYCSSPLFPVVGASEVSPPGMPKKWILKGEAPSSETTWVPAAIVADEGFCQILINARIFKAVVLSRGWNMYRDVRVLRFMVRRWHTDTYTFFFPWGETTVTLEDVERICLLPSMGNVNPLELRLSNAESEIAGKLLETFGGASASWGVLCRGALLPLGTLCLGTLYFELDRLRSDELEGSPYHIIESSINAVIGPTGPDGELQFLGFEAGLPLLMKWMGLKVWNLPSITLLDDGGHFAWKPYSYVAVGFQCPNPFPSARLGSQEFGLNENEKIPNLLLITSPSFIPYPKVCALSDALRPLVHSTALEYKANKIERILVLSKHREGYATPSMKLYWKRVMNTFEGYVKSLEVDDVVIGPLLRELSSNAQLIPSTKAALAWAARQNLGFAEWRADLNGWVVHGGDVPMEWSEKSIIAKALESNPATGAPKRPRGKSPLSEDKPKKVRRQRAGIDMSKAGNPKPLVVAQSTSGATQVTKSSAPADAPTSPSSPTKHYRRKTSAGRVQILETSEEFGEEMQSEGHDSGGMAADFSKLLFLASISSRVSFTDVLCSLGPIDEDVEMAGKSPAATVTAGEAAVGESSKEPIGKDLDVAVTVWEAAIGESSKDPAGKDLDVAVTVEEAVASVPSQGQAISPTVHNAHHEKEPPEIPVEGQPLLATIMRKHPHFIAGCKLGGSLRKSSLELLVAVLLDMQRTKLDSSNLQRVLKWKSAFKYLLFMKFGVQFILDKIRVAVEACITQDDEFSRKIADLEREIAAKRAELALLPSQRDALMQSSSAGGAFTSSETFGDGLFD
nr:hypothetical protein CFP56_70946 [Quercus suber]